MKRRSLLHKQRVSDSPEVYLNQLAHHNISHLSNFQNVLPDPAIIPSIATTSLLSDAPPEQDGYLDLISNLDVRLLPRAEDDSELDSADSDIDPLEHAGVYTTEEVSRIYLENLQKLKSLYSGEFGRLLNILKENKRQYLLALKTEKESKESNNNDQPKESVEEKHAYQELKFLYRYHRKLGKEALLHKQQVDRRMQAGEGGNASASKTALSVHCVKCIYSEGSWRCGIKSVPFSKYCFKHILQDDRQVLFRPCGSVQGGGEECEIPVVPLPYTPTCVYHTPIPSRIPLSELPFRSEPSSSGNSCNPRIIDLSENSAFIISEIPPDDVMEGDDLASSSEKGFPTSTAGTVILNPEFCKPP